MLRHQRDYQSIAYLLALPLLVWLLWKLHLPTPLAILLYCLLIFFSMATGVIHHNHAHLGMWKNKYANRATNFWICILQGHPTFVFYASHNANHHRYHHGAKDLARTYRFGGDTNHLLGYLCHPFQALVVLYPLFLIWLSRIKKREKNVYWYCISQYVLVGLCWTALAFIDAGKFLYLVLLPQLIGLHWLLAANYLQHAHADGNSRINFARNFEGRTNVLFFNIGLHTAHHLHPRAHWSQLPVLHRRYYEQIDARLHAGSLRRYVWRTFIASLFWVPWRSQSLMKNQRQ